LALLGVVALLCCAGCGPPAQEILNVSYDPTRQFYKEYNDAFARYWKDKTGETVVVRMSHGGSAKQARAVIDGLPASVVTLALAYDVDAISRRTGLIAPDWQKRLPHNSCPYTTTIVLVVRKGNPKGIRDWEDLLKPDVRIITPDPKTSGGARWNYLAAWGYVLKRELGDWTALKDPNRVAEVDRAHQKAKEFIRALYRRARPLDTGARGSTITFVKNNIGDVLLAWENEALLISHEMAPGKVEICYPSVSIRAEPPVSVVDKVVDQQGIRHLAEAYLEYLYSPAGQCVAARYHYRPVNPEGIPAELLTQFPPVELFGIDDVFGGWEQAQRTHFDDGGIFDQILHPEQ
jgi:sulfate transport system substrate-binding protein